MKRLTLVLLSFLALLLPLTTHANEQPSPLPTLEEAKEVCEAVINGEPKLVLSEHGKIDVNNDGTPENFGINCQGTANACSPVLVLPNGKNNWPYPMSDDTRIFSYNVKAISYGPHTYILYHADDKTPEWVTYVAPDNIEYPVCQIRETVFAALTEQTEEASGYSTCAKIDVGGLETVPLLPIPPDEPLNIKRWATAPEAKQVLDFDNDGKEDTIAIMHFEGSGGRGCDFSYMLLEDESKNARFDTPSAALLDKIQGGLGTPESSGPGDVTTHSCGGNKIRWLKSAAYEGHVNYFLEFKGNRQNFHSGYDWWVRTIKAGQVVDVCKGDVRREVRVSAYGEMFKQP